MRQDKLIYQEPVMEIMILFENDIATAGIVEASNTGDDNNIGSSNYDDFFNGF